MVDLRKFTVMNVTNGSFDEVVFEMSETAYVCSGVSTILLHQSKNVATARGRSAK